MTLDPTIPSQGRFFWHIDPVIALFPNSFLELIVGFFFMWASRGPKGYHVLVAKRILKLFFSWKVGRLEKCWFLQIIWEG